MSSEYHPRFQSLEIETFTPKFTVKKTIKQEVNIELPLRTFVEHVNLSLANSKASVSWISGGDYVENP